MKAVFCDMYNFQITGDVSASLNANSGLSANHAGPTLLVLNDQGGSVMDITNDITATLRAQDHGHPPVVCHPVYCIEGNVVDRMSSKNGKGWCEDVSPTLNTQDRHAVVVALEGNGARPSHMGKGFSKDGTMYTLNTIEQHSVCYSVESKHEVSHD